ncbi:hypothetical protein HK104_003289, partial [Borealophlyctis nickersoniae]
MDSPPHPHRTSRRLHKLVSAVKSAGGKLKSKKLGKERGKGKASERTPLLDGPPPSSTDSEDVYASAATLVSRCSDSESDDERVMRPPPLPPRSGGMVWYGSV